MNMRITFTYAEQDHADKGLEGLREEYPGLVLITADRKVSCLDQGPDGESEIVRVVTDTLSLDSEDLNYAGIIRVEVVLD